MTSFSLSGAFCLHNRVCILEQTDDSLVVGLVHAEDSVLMDKISEAFISATEGRGFVHFMAVSEEECLRRITGSIADCAEIREEHTGYTAGDENSGSRESSSRHMDVDVEAPAVNLLDNIVLEAIARNASDIHLEPYSRPQSDEMKLRVRFRTAGMLQLFKMYDGSVSDRLIRRIKVLAGLNSSEDRQCQDGRFIWKTAGETDSGLRTDIRVSCIPVWNGESVVLRLLKTLETPPQIPELGFSKAQQEVLFRILSMKSRLIIVSGPTGAGKTTTLAAMLSCLARDGKKIVTIEDPVEYRIPGVSQIEIHDGNNMGFQDVLRRIFRHDPDILMVGEIRDELTARTAVRAALTGHLVFATLHASNACAAAIRLSDLGIPPFLLASVFGAVIAQELIPCPDRMNGRFSGRMPAAEILEGTPPVLSLLSRHCTESELASCMSSHGMQRIDEDAAGKKLLAAFIPGKSSLTKTSEHNQAALYEN